MIYDDVSHTNRLINRPVCTIHIVFCLIQFLYEITNIRTSAGCRHALQYSYMEEGASGRIIVILLLRTMPPSCNLRESKVCSTNKTNQTKCSSLCHHDLSLNWSKFVYFEFRGGVKQLLNTFFANWNSCVNARQERNYLCFLFQLKISAREHTRIVVSIILPRSAVFRKFH